MHDVIYKRLKSIANAENIIHYSDIAPLADLNMANPEDRNKISEILDEISTYEHQHGRPLLSSVVIHRDNNMPGHGYFKMARRVGVYKGNDDFIFFIRELRRVHDYWKQA